MGAAERRSWTYAGRTTLAGAAAPVVKEPPCEDRGRTTPKTELCWELQTGSPSNTTSARTRMKVSCPKPPHPSPQEVCHRRVAPARGHGKHPPHQTSAHHHQHLGHPALWAPAKKRKRKRSRKTNHHQHAKQPKKK